MTWSKIWWKVKEQETFEGLLQNENLVLNRNKRKLKVKKNEPTYLLKLTELKININDKIKGYNKATIQDKWNKLQKNFFQVIPLNILTHLTTCIFFVTLYR